MIGNDIEPGINSTVSSAPTLSSSGLSAGTPVLVGPADLGEGQSQGEAEVGEIYGVTDSPQARSMFGDSHLTDNVIDALGQGAYPVLALVPPTQSASMDISGETSRVIDIENAVSLDHGMTVTLNGTELETQTSVEELTTDTDVGSGEVIINPAREEVLLPSAPTSDSTISYTEVDYQQGLQPILDYEGDIDFIGLLTANESAVSSLLGFLEQMAAREKLAMGFASMPTPVDESSDIVLPVDSSRIQLIEPGYKESGYSAVGAFVGMRADVGLQTTAINQSLNLTERLAIPLDSISDREALINANVTPLKGLGQVARVVDDLTTVSESNTEEQNFRYGFTRLAVDFVIDQLHGMEQPFVGKFNSPGAIGQLSDLLNEQARPLKESNVVYSFSADVQLVTPLRVKVVFQADVAEPIRNITNEVVIGNDLSLQNDQ